MKTAPMMSTVQALEARAAIRAFALLAFAFAFAVVSAAPARAAEVYVPYAIDANLHGDAYRTEIRVYNDASTAKSLRYVFFEAGTSWKDVDPATLATEVTIGPRRTAVFDDWVPAGKLGWIEVDADSGLFVAAKLIGSQGSTDHAGTEIPVVGSKEAVPPGTTTVVSGVSRDPGEVVSDLYMLNFGSDLNQCVVEVYGSDGAVVFTSQSLGQPGVILTQFEDVVDLLGFAEATDMAIAFTCTEPFFPFVVTHALATAEPTVLAPATAADDGFGSSGSGGAECGSGAVCFEKKGLFHTATAGNGVLRLSFKPDPATYRRIRTQVSVTNAGWSGGSGDAHGVFWFVRDKNKDMIGYVAMKSPGSKELLLRHGMGLAHGDKAKETQSLTWPVGATLRFDYVYDTRQGFIELTVTNSASQQVAHLTSVPNVNAVTISASNKLIMDFGASGASSVEPIPIGWKYADLFVELTQ